MVIEKEYLLDSLIYIVTCVTWKSIMKISNEKVSVTFIQTHKCSSHNNKLNLCQNKGKEQKLCIISSAYT